MGVTIGSSALPYELERPIFEQAARADRSSAKSLVFVARRVKIWIDPILYSTIPLIDDDEKRYGPSSLSRFMHAFNSHPKQFFTDHVQHLCLSAATSFEVTSAISVLSACRNVVNLTYGGPIHSWDDVLATLHSPKLQRLGIELPSTAPDPEAHVPRLRTLFENITHLDVLSVWPDVSILNLFPKLTHLALDFDTRQAESLPLLQELSESTILEVVAFIVHSQSDSESGIVESYSGTEDLRFVPLRFRPDLLKDDWNASTCGGNGMWYRAEEAVAARMREHRQYFNALIFHDYDELTT